MGGFMSNYALVTATGARAGVAPCVQRDSNAVAAFRKT